MPESSIPSSRIRRLESKTPNPQGRYVIYWCVSQRRTAFNFALEHAANEARRLGLPLLFLEPLRLGYRWASERQHRFVVEGMRDNAEALKEIEGINYYPYLEDKVDAGKGLLYALAADATLVVSDDAPYFFFPAMHAAAAKKLEVPLVLVDSNGLLPMRSLMDRWSNVAHSFRRWTRDILPRSLREFPKSAPLEGLSGKADITSKILKKWPKADIKALLAEGGMKHLKFAESVAPAPTEGGALRGRKVLQHFVEKRLAGYMDERLNLDDETCSGLSPWLHYGHISAHEIFRAVTEREGWAIRDIAEKPTNKREGWWGASPELEGFLDELITWRELGFHTCVHRQNDYDKLSSLPEWARETHAEHAGDPRPALYDLETLARAKSGDEVWNAAQRQLLEEGKIHNAIRMVWGKLVLAWTPSSQEALDILIELNNRYALDGRDPNSYSGIMWCLGRHDRAWGPERPLYGKVRYMTSESFKRKAKAKRYFTRWGANSNELF